MMLNDDQKNAIDFNNYISKKLQKICSPLKLIGGDHFSYGRIYNKKYIQLGTDIEYIAFFMSNTFRGFSFIVDYLKSNRVLVINDYKDQYPDQPKTIVQEGFAISNLNQAYGMFFYNYIYNYIEFLAIFKKSDEAWHHRIDLLNKFGQYFCLEVHNILNQVEQDNIFIKTSLDVDKQSFQHEEDGEFLSLITPNKIPLKTKNEMIFLTKKETLCLKYLTQGYSVREIAILLANSPRTVEMHIRNIREKTNTSINLIKESFRQSNLSLLF